MPGRLAPLGLGLALLPAALAQRYSSETVAGNPYTVGDGVPATSERLVHPGALDVDSSGNLYIADLRDHRIRRVDAAGIITTIAGTGVPGFSGDDGPALHAQIWNPSGLAVDGAGNLFIADKANYRIRKIDGTGRITTVAGSGSGHAVNGGPATNAFLGFPMGLAVDSAGALFIAEAGMNRIRKVDPAGLITTVAGTGQAGFGGDGGLAIRARFWNPTDVAVDAVGNLYVADHLNHRIRKVDRAGIVTTVAGTGDPPFVSYLADTGDGGRAIDAPLRNPNGLAIGSDGSLYFTNSQDKRVRRIDPAGIITTLATPDRYFRGSAVSNAVSGIAIDGTSQIYVSDSHLRTVRILRSVANAGGLGGGGAGTQAQRSGLGGGLPAIRSRLRSSRRVRVENRFENQD